MNNLDNREEQQTPVVTFSNIPLDEAPAAPQGYDTLPEEAMEPPEITVVDVQFKKGGKVYYFDPGALQVETGDEVIIDTARGAEYGFCAGGNHSVPEKLVVSPLRRVLRVATQTDKRIRQQYKDREPEAMELCQQKIQDHSLDMKLVSAEYSFDGSKILFYFTADGRVDFRDLVKDLAGVFRTRIELRQIGVRDEAKMLGGLGICGRPFCCKQFLDDFQPVSIKMAKTQSLSLNPTKISGTCGRLMCCLKYEQEAYESLIKTSPKNDSLVNTCDGVGTVTDSNLLKQTVKVRLESDPSSIKCYNNCDICVLRNGKARKNDPPIDTNIPPLPKPKAEEPEPAVYHEFSMFDESTLSNYTEGDAEKLAERAERRKAARERAKAQQEARQKERRTGESRSRSQNRSAAQKKQKPQNQKEAAPQEKKEGAPRSSGKKRRYYKGGNNKKSGGQGN